MLLVATAILTTAIAPVSCSDEDPPFSGFANCLDCGTLEFDSPGTGFLAGDGATIPVDAAQDDADVSDADDAGIDADDGNADP